MDGSRTTCRRSRSRIRAARRSCSSWGGAPPRHDHGRCRPRQGGRQEGRDGAPPPPAPFPANTGEVVRAYRKILIPEMNLGQLAALIGRSTSWTRRPTPRCRACRSSRRSWSTRSRGCWMSDVLQNSGTAPGEAAATPDEGLHLRPGPRWCPGCTATTRSSRPCRASCRSWGSNPTRRSSSPGSGAAAGSRTTWTCEVRDPRPRAGARHRDRGGQPDLSVWVVTGDEGRVVDRGNHLIHALRRNVNIKILLFSNQIYGLTKGQYSPTSEEGKVTKSRPSARSIIRSIRSRWRSAWRRRSSRARSTTIGST